MQQDIDQKQTELTRLLKEQADINDSLAVVDHLGIRNFTIDISGAVSAILKEMNDKNIEITDQSRINLPPRIRMSTLYAVSQCHSHSNNLHKILIKLFLKHLYLQIMR